MKYNTLKMIEMLIENPKLRFENTNGDVVCTYENKDIYIKWNRKDWIPPEPFAMTRENINSLWMIVRTPVDFMTAFNAFYEGRKNIICELSDETTEFDCSTMEDVYFPEIMIAEGQWYIKE